MDDNFPAMSSKAAWLIPFWAAHSLNTGTIGNSSAASPKADKSYFPSGGALWAPLDTILRISFQLFAIPSRSGSFWSLFQKFSGHQSGRSMGSSSGIESLALWSMAVFSGAGESSWLLSCVSTPSSKPAGSPGSTATSSLSLIDFSLV